MLRPSLRRLMTQLFANRSSCRSGAARRRKNTTIRQVAESQVFESRMLLSAVSGAGGVISFDADPGASDDVTVSSPDVNTLVIAVGNGDTITLGDGVAGNASFVLSDSDTVLTIDVATASVTDVEVSLGDQADALTVEGLADGITFSVDGGSGDDNINANGAQSSVVLVGGLGNDVLILSLIHISEPTRPY